VKKPLEWNLIPDIKDDALTWTYLIQTEIDPFPIKIGRTTSPRRRISALKTDNPFSIKLVGIFMGPTILEQLFHYIFSDYRLRGEWFLPGERLVSLIEGAKKTPVLRNVTMDTAYRIFSSWSENDDQAGRCLEAIEAYYKDVKAWRHGCPLELEEPENEDLVLTETGVYDRLNGL